MSVKDWSERAQAWRVEQYNDGGFVWLYDASRRTDLQRTGVDPFDCQDPEAPGAETLTDLARAGALVACALYQDDSIDLLVMTGRRPTKKQLAFRRWHEPIAVLLDLPTGQLAIEGANAIQIGDEAPEEPGDVVEVPAGRYRAWLYRLDWLADDDEEEASSESDRPWMVVWLERLKKAEDPELDAHLCVPATPWTPPPAAPAWVGDWRLIDGVFIGLLRVGPDGIELNVDALAAESLGLTAGTRLDVSLDESGETFSGVFLGEDVGSARAVWERWREREHPDGFCEVQWLSDSEPGQTRLLFTGFEGGPLPAVEACDDWRRVRVVVENA